MIALVLGASLALAPLERHGLERLYNLELDEAAASFETLDRLEPASPAGPHYLASLVWMEEMTRRGAMAGETFAGARFWTRRRRDEPSPAVRARFERYVEEARRRARRRLDEKPDDLEALYFLGATEGVVAAFEATLRRRYFAAYRAARRARSAHRRLLELDPDYGDAFLVLGAFEYTVASLPRGTRVLAFLFGARGSKQKGRALLEEAARRGSRTYWGSRLLLVVVDQREKRYARALAWLAELETAFPKNPLFPLERGWTYLLAKNWRAARATFETVLDRRRLGRPHYERVEEGLVRLRLAESLLFDGEAGGALAELDEALRTASRAETRALVYLRRGQALDALGRRDAAVEAYRAAVRLDTDRATRKAAEGYLEKAFRLPR